MDFSKRAIFFESWQYLKKHLGLWLLIMLFIFCFNIIISNIQEKLLNDITTQTILFSLGIVLWTVQMIVAALDIFQNEQGLSISKLNQRRTGKSQDYRVFGSLFPNVFQYPPTLFRSVQYPPSPARGT